MKKNYLLTPGPTPLPPQVMEALSRPIIHHRTPQFQEILRQAHDGLKYVFQTSREVFILASSGTGAMESAVVNFLSPGDKVITVEAGKFGERWTEICRAYGIECDVVKAEWGTAVKPEQIRERITASETPVKAVFTTLCETSTGVATDIRGIGEIVKKSGAILVVDAISGLGAIDLKADEWGCDVVVSGSQKGLMLPPGLGFVSVSEKAWKAAESSTCPKYYLNLKEAKKAYAKTDTPWTPAIGLIVALNEVLTVLKAEGLETIFSRHHKLAEATRSAMKGLGLELFAKDYSDVVTAVKVPAGIDGEKLVKVMRDIHGVTIAGGQSELKGKVFRIAHMGYMDEFDIIIGISCLEKVLAQAGYKFQPGAGVAAAEKVFLA